MKPLLIVCTFSVFLVLCSATPELSLSSKSSPSEDEESSSSGSSASSSSFQVKVEEHETNTDSKGTYQITKVFERKKTDGGNETSSSRTVEVFRFPNGTIQRKVKNNGQTMKAECATKKDCPANKFCNKLTYQCQDCIQDFGCFGSEQCCDGKVCRFGKCEVKREHTGLVHSPCRSDQDCKAELYCQYSMFSGGMCMKRKTEGHSCNSGMFPDPRMCADALKCKRFGGFPFFNYKCMKKGSMQEDKSNWAESPFGWFDADVLFDDQK